MIILHGLDGCIALGAWRGVGVLFFVDHIEGGRQGSDDSDVKRVEYINIRSNEKKLPAIANLTSHLKCLNCRFSVVKT